ncbi:MAG: LemA family protein [Spirochaetia bacterium]|nr:MAG: LemA family protein [Spirochaetia bacterium]
MTKKILIGVAVVIVLILGYGWLTYNNLVTTNENVDNQWAQVETQYQRRVDLIPNLVNSVKGVMSQEQTVFGAISDARTRYAGAITVNDKAMAASQVESAFGRLLAVMENYPELKSAENVQTLMAQLEGTENRVSVERKRFNDMVRNFNLMTKRFPSSVVASMFGFSEKVYFESAPGAENAPVVEF